MEAVLDQTLDVGTYLQSWLDHARGRVRQKTWQTYESMIRTRVGEDLRALPLADLHPLHLQGLYAELLKTGLSGGSVLNLHLVLTNALSQAVRWGYIGANPAAGAQPPRPRRKELQVLDQQATEAILEAASGTRMEAPIGIAIATGMRRGEVLGLRWPDIDEAVTYAQVSRTLQNTTEGLVFEQPKTRRSRRKVVLPAFLKPYLERQKADQALRREALGEAWVNEDVVVDFVDGSPWNPDSFTPAWAAFLRRAGLPHVRFHDLRHAHATLMLSKGVHPKIVSERLGHASIGITLDPYSHVLPAMQQEAADAFDDLFSVDKAVS